MHDMDDLMPEFEARYQAGQEDQQADADNDAAGNTAGRGFTIQISRTFPVVRGLMRTGEGKDVYLVEQDGAPRVLKFFRPGPDEEFFRGAKQLSEQLHEIFLRIHEYGFDENTKRWYVIEEYAGHGSLQDLTEAGAGLSDLPLLIQAVLERLKVLHDHHAVHLRLKPSNILLRESHPPQPAFSDFSVVLMTESGNAAKIPPFTDRQPYAAPELLTGLAGKEADYWSLGVVLLVLLLGRSPSDDFDDQSITKILSVHPLALPGSIPEDYAPLLRGLLTRDPGGRWGYAEVTQWLQRDAGIPLQVREATEEAAGKPAPRYAVPFRFLRREYSSLPEMIPAFLKSEEAWKAAADHLEKGDIAAWILKNSDTATRARIDAIRERYAGDPDLALIGLIYSFQPDLPFVLHGKLITRKNLYIYAGRSLKHESSGAEESVVRCLLNGRLSEYYREYGVLAAKADDELITLFEVVRKAVSRKAHDQDKLAALFKILNIIAAPAAYLLPLKVSDNVMGNLYALAENIDMVIPRETYQEMTDSLIIPETLKEKISNAVAADLGPSYAGGLEKLRDGSLLTKEEFAMLEENAVLPEWLTGGLLGKETSGYLAAMNLLRKLKGEGLLIGKNDFLDFVRNYAQYIGHIFTPAVAVPQGRKGEPPEQRWFRWLKSDVGREEYLTLAKHIKNRANLSMFSKIGEILTRVSGQSISSEAVHEIVKAVEVLKSGEVRWDDNDKQMVTEIHSSTARKEGAPLQILEKITRGGMGRGFHAFLKTLLRIDADERTRETEGAFAGFLGGVFLGLVIWPVIVSLELNFSYYGPAVLGLLIGLTAKSVAGAILLASAGAAATFFSGMETLIEVLYAFLLSISGGTRIGAFIGKRLNRYSLYDAIAAKYRDRLTDIITAAETPSD
jgi:hypothetical protein